MPLIDLQLVEGPFEAGAAPLGPKALASAATTLKPRPTQRGAHPDLATKGAA